jgi:predicted ABC-type transport system involved in lysophospholipase L1 biosynthesis ATPase subunit
MWRLIMHASHISKVYRPAGPNPIWALTNIDLRIYAGDLIAIVGAPGAGKTTLLRILGLQEPPTCGDLYYKGRLITGLTTSDLRPDIRFLDEPTAVPSPTPAQAIVLATADPEIAARGSTIYRLTDGRLERIGG